MKWPVLVLWVAALTLGGCDSIGAENYHPGQVVVQLRSGSAPDQLLEFAADHDLPAPDVYIPDAFLADIAVPIPETEAYADRLLRTGTMKHVTEWQPGVLRLAVPVNRGLAGLESLLVDYPGSSVSYTQFYPVRAVVYVRPGREARWIRKLKREVFVEIAELNGKVYPRAEPTR